MPQTTDLGMAVIEPSSVSEGYVVPQL